MPISRMIQITKDATIPISLGLLGALVFGVWALAVRVAQWEMRLDHFEQSLGDRWTYRMERESWTEYKSLNPTTPVPNILQIKTENTPN